MQSRLEILILTAIAIQMGSDRASRCNCCLFKRTAKGAKNAEVRGEVCDRFYHA
ncbi:MULTISPECIES: hypothetical protein [Cyanophyceae]|uniref:hypothetical protein n=1 Tax=Cyanophyceae TaxID=3028117 RepID=UPI0016831EDE|nr:hypothetical protein [Trichocoleus sp. FACHB-40]MBD2002000.1 hypothetical protein [Trichocoleus sp. FACHB-40]